MDELTPEELEAAGLPADFVRPPSPLHATLDNPEVEIAPPPPGLADIASQAAEIQSRIDALLSGEEPG